MDFALFICSYVAITQNKILNLPLNGKNISLNFFSFLLFLLAHAPTHTCTDRKTQTCMHTITFAQVTYATPPRIS